MGYRGEDLDLRTPQTWSATPADLAGYTADPARGRGGFGVPRNGPIWVDETVLACCNHAFDVALLNRAGEVRLEHLLHALTRIDAAAEALEARGVRVAALRRDTATVIASEIPIGLPNGKGTPRRSEPLEEALRLAAGYASRRNGPATVDDLLHIVMDVEPTLPGLALIARNTARQQPFAEPAARASYAPEPRITDFAEPARPRMPAGTYYFNEPARPARSDILGSATDTIQNSRLDALEQMVRALGSDLATERKSFMGLLQELQREISTQREEASRMGGGLHERLQTVDAIIERRMGELSRPWLQMNDRLQGLEHAMVNVRPSAVDLSPVADRIAALERVINAMRPAAAPDLAPVVDRIAAFERSVLNASPSSAADLGPMNERISALERAVNNSLGEGARNAEMIAGRVKSVEAALATRPSVVDGRIDFAPLTQRLDMIEEAVLSREAATREIADRLSRQEDVLAADRTIQQEAYDKLLGEVRSLSALIDREGGETATTVLDSLSARLEGLAGVIEGRHSETAQALASNAASVAGLIERLAATEALTREHAERSGKLTSTHTQELAEVHDALMKLNSNQHTLAGSIERWHQDQATSMSLIGSRMETVEREAGKPVALLEDMGHTLDRLHKVTAERYYRRNRFWYWLFGTDDWIASSWPGQAARIGDDPRVAKPVMTAVMK